MEETLKTALQVLNSAGLVGVAGYMYWLFKGLRERVDNLKTLAEEQKATLQAVRDRAEEFDKLSQRYKAALSDFEEMGAKLEARRQQLVKELEDANLKKDGEIIELKKHQLAEVELKQKSYDRLPELVKNLQDLSTDLERQIRIIGPARHLVGLGRRLGPRTYELSESGWSNQLFQSAVIQALTGLTPMPSLDAEIKKKEPAGEIDPPIASVSKNIPPSQTSGGSSKLQ